MNEVILRLYSEKSSIEPSFLESLESFASQHGYRIVEERSAFSEEEIKKTALHNFIRESEAFSKRGSPIDSNLSADIREMRDAR